jgi:excisionase family DNA binding protein
MGTIAKLEQSSRFFDNQRNDLERLLTKKQLGQVLALSQSYINELMHDGGLPHIKIGRAVRFRVSEIMAWLQKRSRP